MTTDAEPWVGFACGLVLGAIAAGLIVADLAGRRMSEMRNYAVEAGYGTYAPNGYNTPAFKWNDEVEDE